MGNDTGLRNWAGNITFAARRLVRPRSVEQLQDLVAGAREIRVLGSGHSFSPVADTTGDLVSVADIDGEIEVDVAARTVRVPAGTRYGELAAAVQAEGLALENLGSLPHISVAGACATGTHGSGPTNQCLPAAVSAVAFVAADGAVVDADDTHPDFGALVLALGAHGVVTALTLRLVPTFDVAQYVWRDAPLDAVLEHFDTIMGAGYSVSIFSSTTRPDVVDQIWVKSRLLDGPPVDGREWGARPARGQVHPLDGVDAAATTVQLGQSGPWNERLPHFRADTVPSAGAEQQSEYLVPAEHGAEALGRVHRLGLGDVLLTIEIRAVASDGLWLSPAGGRDGVAVHFTWRNDDAAVAAALARVEAVLEPFSPRPHWGKVFTLGADAVRAQYPRLPDFAALAARHDPNRKFGNAFLERYVY